MLFSAFFEEFKRTVLAVFCQFIRGNGTSGVGYIDYENFTGKTVDQKNFFFKKQSAWKLAYLFVIYDEGSSLD